MRVFNLVIVLAVLSAQFGIAQRNCGSVDYINRIGAGAFNQQSAYRGSEHFSARDTAADEIINIPVVVHVIYNNAIQNISDAQVMSQIRSLNEDFRRLNRDASTTPEAFKTTSADCKIMFCLAQVDPKGRTTKGIIRKYTDKSTFPIGDAMKFSAAGGDDAWDSHKYLNIWVCNMQGSCIGFGTPPGGQSDKDGIVIQYDCFGTTGSLRPQYNKGRTATHEIGHWMGLLHIWGDNSCGNDGIDDTPTQSGYNSNCPSFPHKSTCSPTNDGDMFMNYMDYTNDACMNMFTNGQKKKMRSCFASGAYRNSFLNSYACDSTLALGSGETATNTSSNVAELKTASVSVFPNPVNDRINLLAVNGYDLMGKTVAIYNMTGKLVIKKTLMNEETSIMASNLTPGIYMLSIGEGQDRKMVKIVKM